jgi:hypothetical protein
MRPSQLSDASRNVQDLQFHTSYYDRNTPLHAGDLRGVRNARREKNEGIEDAYPDVEFREVDIQTDLERAEEYGV